MQLLAQLTLGGPAWGLACGIGIVIVLRFVYNDELTEVTLTIAAAFACFITGNTIFVVSGVLAIVVMGIYMSAHGALYISRPVYHSLHVVWENLEFIGNTIIFVLSGTIISDRIIESNQDNGITHIQASDYGYAVALWLLLLAIRAFIFILLYPLLKITGMLRMVLCTMARAFCQHLLRVWHHMENGTGHGVGRPAWRSRPRPCPLYPL